MNKIKMFSVVMIAGMVFFGAGCTSEEEIAQAKRDCKDDGGRRIELTIYSPNKSCNMYHHPVAQY